MNQLRHFNSRRFIRLAGVEIINVWKKVLLATGALIAISFFIFVDVATGPGPEGFFEGIFIFFTFISGALFTSVIFCDIHHPLERYQCLTLPCSSLERLASKYLITGPAFLIYVLLAVFLFELVAPVIVELFSGRAGPEFIPFREIPGRYLLILFLSGHALFLIGSIVFKSYAVVKTAFCIFVLPYTFFFVAIVALKIIYFDHFDSFLSMQRTENILPGVQILLVRSEAFIITAWSLVYLWLLYISYLCLKDHEA